MEVFMVDRKEYHKQWYENNREKVKEDTKQWRIDNPEKVREIRRLYRENNVKNKDLALV